MRHVSLILIILIIGCNNNSDSKKKLEDEKVQKYVYIDDLERLHVSTSCINLIQNDLGIRFLEIESITDSMLLKLCPGCVDDQRYEILKNMEEKRDSALRAKIKLVW